MENHLRRNRVSMTLSQTVSSLTCSTKRRQLLAIAGASMLFASNVAFAEAAPRVEVTTSAGNFVVELYPDKGSQDSGELSQIRGNQTV